MDNNDYKGLLRNKPDYLVCTCMGVMYLEILDMIEQGADTFDKLSDILMVGTGCTSCVDEVRAILEDFHKKS